MGEPPTPPRAELLLARATRSLSARETPESARLEAELLLAHALGLERVGLLLDPEVPAPAAARFEALLAERVERGRPLAHLLGERGFWDLVLAVDARVLTPRPESELLVQTLFELLDAGRLPEGPVGDRGTGSGCLALAASERRPVLAVERSADALDVAAENLARMAAGTALPDAPAAEGARRAARVVLVHAEGLGVVRAGALAAVLANPPYVRPEEHERLEPEVRVHEPRDALVPRDGDVAAEFLRVGAEAAHALARGGALLLEIGEGDAALAKERLAAHGFTDLVALRDLAGHERVICAWQPR